MNAFAVRALSLSSFTQPVANVVVTRIDKTPGEWHWAAKANDSHNQVVFTPDLSIIFVHFSWQDQLHEALQKQEQFYGAKGKGLSQAKEFVLHYKLWTGHPHKVVRTQRKHTKSSGQPRKTLVHQSFPLPVELILLSYNLLRYITVK